MRARLFLCAVGIVVGVSFFLRFFQLSEYVPFVTQKEIKLVLAAAALSSSGVDAILLFSKQFGFVDTLLLGPFTIGGVFIAKNFLGEGVEGVRIFSALLSCISIVLFFLLCRKSALLWLYRMDKEKQVVFASSATILYAYSPIHFQVSRIDPFVMLGMVLFFLGVVCGLYQEKKIAFWAAWGFLIASFYADFLFFLPACVAIGMFFWDAKKKGYISKKVVIGVCIAMVVVSLPILNSLTVYHFQIGREMWDGFAMAGQRAEKRIEMEGSTKKAQLFQHPAIEQGKFFLDTFTKYFEPSYFLFHWPFNHNMVIRQSGLIFPLDFIVLCSGIVFLWKKNKKIVYALGVLYSGFGVMWTFQTGNPDATKLILFLPFLSVISSLGFIFAGEVIKTQWKILCTIFLIGYVFFVGRFFFFYFSSSSFGVPNVYREYQQSFSYVDTHFPSKRVFVEDSTYGKDLFLYWIYWTHRQRNTRRYIELGVTKRFDQVEFFKNVVIAPNSQGIFIVPRAKIASFKPKVLIQVSKKDEIIVASFVKR